MITTKRFNKPKMISWNAKYAYKPQMILIYLLSNHAYAQEA